MFVLANLISEFFCFVCLLYGMGAMHGMFVLGVIQSFFWHGKCSHTTCSPFYNFTKLSNSHCPWVGNCIGARNYRFFFAFLITISLEAISISATCFRILIESYHEAKHPNPETDVVDMYDTLSDMPTVVILAFLMILFAWSLVSLTGFHALIVSRAQTTNEKVRGVYQNLDGGNPADHGLVENWKQAFCIPVPKSRLPRQFGDEVVCPGYEDGHGVGQEGENVWDAEKAANAVREAAESSDAFTFKL
jgi:hypothetical protein